ncbi:hypothetical protein Bca52824_003363 [Brassica carinata]|uniref:Jacalin-type lectin domain-containing protein n=1 Tax=Brassica carinata TaxID=52824 RepID=A0A8X8BF56_BRACI|nr:hypothetical protein Bca52824_003363 [Brassica carinata]
MMKLGPLGCDDSSGKTWEEMGGSDRISHILVSFDDKNLKSIQFGYVKNGALVMSKKHGSSDSDSTGIVRLNQDEYVTGLSGSLGYYGGITNFLFHTNRGKHGPSANDDTYAPCPKIEIDPSILDRREFGGFFGSYSSSSITSIGNYVNPIPCSHGVTKHEKL